MSRDPIRKKRRDLVSGEEHPPGLLIQEGLPASPGQLIEEAKALGVKVGKQSSFGFRSVDRSSPVPVTKKGAPIVDAADGLRKRRRGETSLNGRVVTKQGKDLVARVDARRSAKTAD
jgi:hypothetical protein